ATTTLADTTTTLASPTPVPAHPTPAASSRDAVAAAILDVQSAAADGSALDRILSLQLNILSQQLQLLRGASDARKAAPLHQPSHASTAPSITSEVPARRFVAHEPIQPHAGEALSASQRAHSHELIDRITRRMAAGLRMAEESRPHVATSRTTAGFRMLWKRA